MANTKFTNPEEYNSSFSKEIQKFLRTVQKTISDAVPDAEEVISYNIPAFKYEGGWIFYYSAYTAHYSLSCPPPWNVFDKYEKELSEYKLSKSTIQFPYDKPIPVKLIAAMSKFRAAELKEAKAAK